MTNEEAKKNLLAYAYYVDEPMPPDVAKAFDMAIKALEQPEPCEDAVSRQASLEKIRTLQTYKLFAGDDMILVDKAQVQTELMMLPSAQTESEVISKWKKEFREYVDSLDITRDDWKGIIEYIDELPSVQSDIIRCKDCKHWNPQLKTANGDGLGSCDFHNVALVTSEGFCYWAERGEQE